MLTQVQALQATYLLNGSLDSDNFERRAVDRLNGLGTPQTRVDAFSTFVLEDEMAKTGIPNLVLLAVAGLLIGMLIALSIGRNQFDALQSRILVGLGGMLVVPLSIAFSGGCFLVLGYKFSMISAVAAFLLLAIGVDDLFVLVASFDQVQAK
jgi:predicted RND superfamily exporter protein